MRSVASVALLHQGPYAPMTPLTRVRVRASQAGGYLDGVVLNQVAGTVFVLLDSPWMGSDISVVARRDVDYSAVKLGAKQHARALHIIGAYRKTAGVRPDHKKLLLSTAKSYINRAVTFQDGTEKPYEDTHYQDLVGYISSLEQTGEVRGDVDMYTAEELVGVLGTWVPQVILDDFLKKAAELPTTYYGAPVKPAPAESGKLPPKETITMKDLERLFPGTFKKRPKIIYTSQKQGAYERGILINPNAPSKEDSEQSEFVKGILDGIQEALKEFIPNATPEQMEAMLEAVNRAADTSKSPADIVKDLIPVIKEHQRRIAPKAPAENKLWLARRELFDKDASRSASLDLSIVTKARQDTPTVPMPASPPGTGKQWVWDPEAAAWTAMDEDQTET